MAYYFGDALKEIKKIKGKADGHLDFDTMPQFAKVKKKDEKKNEVHDERDLGAMISMLTVAVQQLTDRIEKLEAKK